MKYIILTIFLTIFKDSYPLNPEILKYDSFMKDFEATGRQLKQEKNKEMNSLIVKRDDQNIDTTVKNGEETRAEGFQGERGQHTKESLSKTCIQEVCGETKKFDQLTTFEQGEVIGKMDMKYEERNSAIEECNYAVRYFQFWRNLRYSVEQFGALIEPMYKDSHSYMKKVDKVLEDEQKRKTETITEIVRNLASAAMEFGESFNISNEWSKLKRLGIPVLTLQEVVDTYNRVESDTSSLKKAKDLGQMLVELNNADSPAEAQEIWNRRYTTWPERTNVVITVKEKKIAYFVHLSPDEQFIIEKMGKSQSPEEIRQWAHRKNYPMSIINYILHKKATANVDEVKTDLYQKCEFIFHVHSDDPRIKSILNWIEKDWIEEKGYIGFTKETPIYKKINMFCSEDSHIWSEACKPPHSQNIQFNSCVLTKKDTEKLVQMVSGKNKIREEVMKVIMSMFFDVQSPHTSTARPA